MGKAVRMRGGEGVIILRKCGKAIGIMSCLPKTIYDVYKLYVYIYIHIKHTCMCMYSTYVI